MSRVQATVKSILEGTEVRKALASEISEEKTLADFQREYRDALAAGADPSELEAPEVAYMDYMSSIGEYDEDTHDFPDPKEDVLDLAVTEFEKLGYEISSTRYIADKDNPSYSIIFKDLSVSKAKAAAKKVQAVINKKYPSNGYVDTEYCFYPGSKPNEIKLMNCMVWHD